MTTERYGYYQASPPKIDYEFVDCSHGSAYQQRVEPAQTSPARSFKLGDILYVAGQAFRVRTVYWLGKFKARVELVPAR